MSEFFLKLGDVLQIIAPSNQILHNKIYTISYLDNTIINLLNTKQQEYFTLIINQDGRFDRPIESIYLLERNEKSGYSQQNNLAIGSWINIVFLENNISIKGKITNREEDMIEIDHEGRKIYIDFAYKGLPNFIKSITKIDPPTKTTLAESDIPPEIPISSPIEIETRMKEILLEADEIELGEDLEEITEVVNVPEEEKRFDIDSQKNDLLNDLLSIVPPSQRKYHIMREINKNIQRFQQLRQEFSLFNKGMPISNVTIDKKPLIQSLKQSNHKILWLLPVIEAHRKLYNIEEAPDDAVKSNLYEELEHLLELADTLSYNEYMVELNRYWNSFISPQTNLVTIIRDIDAVIDNYDDYNSSIVKFSDDFSIISKGEFIIQRLFNDTVSLKGILQFPINIINYSKINLPKTSIYMKTHLSKKFFSYKNLYKSHKFYEDTILHPFTEDNFFENLVPTILDALEIVKETITEPYSYLNILKALEPFLIYRKNIGKKEAEKIRRFLYVQQKQYKTQTNENNKQFQILASKLEVIEDIEEKDSLFDDNIKKLYKLKPNQEYLKQIIEFDNGRMFTQYLSLQNIDLHSNINIVNLQKEESTKEPTKEPTCEYTLAKEYLDIEELNKDDNIKELFFDKKFDQTRYMILDEFKTERTQLSEEEFKLFLLNHLIKTAGLSEIKAKDEVEALLKGRRPVKENHYSILKEPATSDLFYYKRVQHKWIRDETLDGKKFTDIFCNVEKKDLKIDPTIKDFKKKLMKDILNNFDQKFHLSKEELQARLNNELQYNIENSARLEALRQGISIKEDLKKMSLQPEDMLNIVTSPMASLRDTILNMGDFVKKQDYIILFVNKFCEKQDQYWYKCITTGVPLIPSFLKVLADAFKRNHYLKTLDIIEREQGALSDSGEYIVDKYSGFIIRKIDFDESEGYNESGFKKVTRDIIHEDLGDMYKKKEEESVNIKKIKNIVITICNFMGITLNSMDFIVQSTIHSLQNESNLKNYKEMSKKKKMPPFRFIFNDYLLYYTLGYLLISIVSHHPTLKTKKNFPGCKKSFTGYPLGDGNNAINYLICIVHKIKSNVGVWKVLLKSKAETIKKKLKLILDKKILKRENVLSKLQEKRELPEEIYIPAIHDVSLWETFRPPLQSINTHKIPFLGANFTNSFKANILKGNKQQVEQLNIIQGKSQHFSIYIQELIQDIIDKNNPILMNSLNQEPFLENICCRTTDANVVQYFMNENPKIGKLNEYVFELNHMKEEYRALYRPPLLIDITDTRLIYPEKSNLFTEKIIYQTFLYFCKYKYKLLPQEFLDMCNIELLGNNLEENIIHLKREGKNFSSQHMNEFLKFVSIPIEHEKDMQIIHSHQQLINALTYLKEKNYENNKLLDLLKNITDSFDVLDWSKEGKEYASVLNLRNYLIPANKELSTIIIDFLKDNGSLGKKDALNILDFLTNLSTMNQRGNSIYMDKDDETSFFISQFLKQAIVDLCTVYPTMISNEIDYTNIPLPKHWNISEYHKNDLKNIIKSEFNSFPSFYSNKNIETIKKETQYLLFLTKHIPFYSKMNGKDTIFDGSVVRDIMLFIFLSCLQKYMFLEGDSREMASFILTLINILMERKKILDINNEMIKERILKRKEKEKNIITKRLKDLTDEERKIENLQKNLKLGDWNLGQTKELHQYSKTQFDKERNQIVEQALYEAKVGQFDEVTERLQNVLSLDDQITERRNKEQQMEMAQLGDDDDFGDMDGDERF